MAIPKLDKIMSVDPTDEIRIKSGVEDISAKSIGREEPTSGNASPRIPSFNWVDTYMKTMFPSMNEKKETGIPASMGPKAPSTFSPDTKSTIRGFYDSRNEVVGDGKLPSVSPGSNSPININSLPQDKMDNTVKNTILAKASQQSFEFPISGSMPIPQSVSASAEPENQGNPLGSIVSGAKRTGNAALAGLDTAAAGFASSANKSLQAIDKYARFLGRTGRGVYDAAKLANIASEKLTGKSAEEHLGHYEQQAYELADESRDNAYGNLDDGAGKWLLGGVEAVSAMAPTLALAAMSGGGSAVGGALTSAGGYVPTIASSTASAVPGLSKQALSEYAANFQNMTPFMIQAGGNYAAEAEKNGYGLEQQVAFGIAGGLAEGITEMMSFGPLKKAFGLSENTLKPMVKKGTMDTVKYFGKKGIEWIDAALANVAEEIAVNPLVGAAEKAILDQDKPLVGDEGIFSMSETKDSSKGALAMSVVLMMVGLPKNAASYATARRYIENGKTPTESEAKKLVKVMEADLDENMDLISAAKDGAIFSELGLEEEYTPDNVAKMNTALYNRFENAYKVVERVNAEGAEMVLSNPDVTSSLTLTNNLLKEAVNNDLVVDKAKPHYAKLSAQIDRLLTTARNVQSESGAQTPAESLGESVQPVSDALAAEVSTQAKVASDDAIKNEILSFDEFKKNLKHITSDTDAGYIKWEYMGEKFNSNFDYARPNGINRDEEFAYDTYLKSKSPEDLTKIINGFKAHESTGKVGKKQGSTVSVHRSIESQSDYSDVIDAAKEEAGDIDYDLVKFNGKTGAVTFIKADDFDSKSEPKILSETTVTPNGEVEVVTPENKIIVDKAAYVPEDYAGFNVTVAKAREKGWRDTKKYGAYDPKQIEDEGYFGERARRVFENIAAPMTETEIPTTQDSDHTQSDTVTEALQSYDEAQKTIDDLDDELIRDYGEKEWLNASIGRETTIPQDKIDQMNRLVEIRDSIEAKENDAIINNLIGRLKFDNSADEWVAPKDAVENVLIDNLKAVKLAGATGNGENNITKESLYNQLIQATDAPQELWGEYDWAKQISEGQADSPFGKSLKPFMEQIDSLSDAILNPQNDQLAPMVKETPLDEQIDTQEENRSAEPTKVSTGKEIEEVSAQEAPAGSEETPGRIKDIPMSGFKKGEFTIKQSRTTKDGSSRNEDKKVHGVVFGNFGIENDSGVITHIPSGLALSGFDSINAAKKAIRYLSAVSNSLSEASMKQFRKENPLKWQTFRYILSGYYEGSSDANEETKTEVQRFIGTLNKFNEKTSRRSAKPVETSSAKEDSNSQQLNKAPSSSTEQYSMVGAFYAPTNKVAQGQIKVDIAAGEVESMTKALADLKREFNLGITSKRYRKRKALGYYDTRTGNIGTKYGNTIGVFSHEFGHRLDAVYKITANHKAALTEMAGKLPESVRKVYSNRELPGEAFADFMRLYMTDPSGAYEFGTLKNGENFYDSFEKLLSEKHKTVIEKTRAKLLKYIASEVHEKYKASIKSYNDTESVPLKERKFDLYMKLVDKYEPINKLMQDVSIKAGRRVSSALNAYKLALMSDRSEAISYNMTMRGMSNPEGDIIGGSFRDIFKDVPRKSMKDFEAYLKMIHTLDRAKQQKLTVSPDISMADTEAEIMRLENQYPAFKETADKLYAWWDQFVRTWIVDTGLMPQPEYNMLRKIYPHYVPMFRVNDRKGGGYRGANEGFSNQTNPMRRSSLKGSDLDTYSPIESMVLEIDRYVKTVMRRNVMLTMHQLYHDKDYAGAFQGILQKAGPEFKTFEFDSRESKDKIEEALIDQKISELSPDEKAAYDKLSKEKQLEYRMSLSDRDVIDDAMNDAILSFIPQKTSKDQSFVTVNDEGKAYFYEVLDPYMADALQSLSPRQLGFFLRTLSEIKRMMTMLTTGNNPIFGVTSNIWRDLPQAYILGNYNNPFTFGREVMKAAVEVIRSTAPIVGNPTQEYLEYKAMGAGFESLAGSNRKYLASSVRKMGARDYSGAKGKGRAAIDAGATVLDAIGSFNDILETAPRLAVYKKSKSSTTAAVKKQILDKMTASEKELYNNMSEDNRREFLDLLAQDAGIDYQARIDAIYEANDVTVNFGRGGTFNEFSAIIPFFTAGVQGLDKMYRAGVKDKDKMAARTAKAAGITLLALIEYIINDDDDNYHALPNYIRDHYWVIPDPNGEEGQFIRIPKPRELGFVFGTLPQRALNEILHSEEDNGEALKESFFNNFLPPVRPVWAPLWDVAKNESWSGSPIVSQRYQNTPEHLQYDDTTSRVGVGISEALHEGLGVETAPINIDYLIKSYAGGIGQIGLPLLTPSAGAEGLAAGMQRKMSADTAYSSRYVDDFYDIDTKLRDANAELKIIMQKEGALERGESMSVEKSEAFLKKYKGKVPDNLDEKQRIAFGKISKNLSDYWAEIRTINNNRDLSYEERQSQIRKIRLEVNERCQEAVVQYEKGKK